MPKVVITLDKIPKVLSILDKWRGKLTWDLYCQEVAKVLGLESVDRGTLNAYGDIKAAFQKKKENSRKSSEHNHAKDSTIDVLLKEIAEKESKIIRIEDKLNKYKEQFVRWQNNFYMMPGVDLDKLNKEIDAPLPTIKRK
ncbi:MAG: hypothetical protein CVU69_04945 [Deltaproteobacteria bacterium HGW-Deltaproteobacteria-4]|nr:MAG: hypothetical protein CVU69_04945 [Deltaproteobacteria bacterium HGW-Deltaproteobacteria-4]